MSSITDEYDGLTVHHFNDCDINSSTEIKQTRGIIKEGDVIVCKSFPFVPEYRSDNENLTSLIEPFFQSNSKIFNSLEGTILRIWFRPQEEGGKWYLSTHRKIDAFLSRWGSDMTYGEHFIHTLTSSGLSDILTFEDYTNKLNKDKIYVLLLRSSKQNRVVCTSQETTKLYTIGAFDRSNQFSFQYEVPETMFPSIPEIKLDSAENAISYTNNIDPFDMQGIIFISSTGECFKVLNTKYEDMMKLRGNIPNVILRYIQLRSANSPEDLELYKKLYSDFSADFSLFEVIISDISKNIHKKYITRFIHRKLALIPPEQYRIVKELHGMHQQDKKFIVTQNAVNQYLSMLYPGKLMYLYNKYIERKSTLGNGNFLTDEEKLRVYI
jgi:hypothetical protein